MLSQNDKVLVAVSGGPDSVAMLYLLNDLAQELNLKLHIAHLNHLLRPKEANRDMRFVITLAGKLNIPLSAEKIDAGKFIKKERLSPEEGARILRYDFLLKTAKKIKARKIAVAHTQDDQAETVLMRLLRGSGLLGLSAISPIRKMGNCLIIRPAIDISRREIEKYLKKNKLRYCLDSSNKKNIFLRNKIRSRLLPYLKKNYKKSISEILSRTAKNVALDYEYHNKEAEEVFKKISAFKNGQLFTSLKALKKLHLYMQKQMFHLAVQKIKGNANNLEDRHYDLFIELIKNKKQNALELPSGILLNKKSGKIIFLKKTKKEPAKKIGKTRLKIPGITTLQDLDLAISAKLLKKVDLAKIKQKKSSLVEYFDYEKLNKPLSVRFRQKGDKFQPLGMKEVKSLKEFFIDQKIPREERALTPLVVDRKNIVWVTGARISTQAMVTLNTIHTLKLTLHQKTMQGKPSCKNKLLK